MEAPHDRTTEFLQLLNDSEKRLKAHVFAVVRDVAAAEDILQETRMRLWQNFDQFETGTNFLAWARKIAFHQILNYRRKAKRGPSLLSDDFLSAVAQEIETLDTDVRRQALTGCLQKLADNHRKIILMRYFESMSIDAIAEAVDRPAGGVYRVLSRIRAGLSQCIRRQLAAEMA